MKWSWIIGGQVLIAVLVAVTAVLLAGKNAGISSGLASASCIIPNMVMPVGFYLNDKVLKKSGFAALFVLELIKIALTIVAVIAIFWLYKDVNWVAFLVSFVVALKSYVLLLLKLNK